MIFKDTQVIRIAAIQHVCYWPVATTSQAAREWKPCFNGDTSF